MHVEQALALSVAVSSAVADARQLDLDDGSVDAVLLLGPLYHLYDAGDREQTLREARRIARPSAPIYVAAISRWAPRLHGYLVSRLYEQESRMAALVQQLEIDGLMPPLFEGSFCGYCHRPDDLRAEIEQAGLQVESVVAVEGVAFALPDLAERMADPVGRSAVLESAKALEAVPELLGLGPHLLATCRSDS
jgi:SAM-dependent methyltransferase